MKFVVSAAFLLMTMCFVNAQDQLISSVSSTISSSMVMSASRRFAASGLSSAQNMIMAEDAETIAQEIESITDVPLPFRAGERVYIMMSQDPSVPTGGVIRAQGWLEGRLLQRLYIVNIEQLNQEDILEALTRLLLDRYIASKALHDMPEEKRPQIPAWLSFGVAQNTAPELRARNRELVLKRWNLHDAMSIKDIVALQTYPLNRWSSKAICGLFVTFMCGSAKSGNWAYYFQSIANGESGLPAWLSSFSPDTDYEIIQKKWDIWVLRQESIQQGWDNSLSVAMSRLDEVLMTPLPRDVDEDVFLASLRELIPLRNEAWMSSYAGRMAVNIRALGIGQNEEFTDVVELYAYFFDAIKEPVPEGAMARLFGRGISDDELEEMLNQAEQKHQRLKKQTEQVEVFMDSAEMLINNNTSE